MKSLISISIADLCEAHYRFLSFWPGAVRGEYAGAALIGNRLIPIPFRSHVALVRSQPEDVPDLIEHANGFYQDMGAPPAFQLDLETTPTDLPQSLLDAGYIKQTEEVWMLCPLSDAPLDAPPAHVTIEQVTPASPDFLIQAYIDSYNISFRAPAHVHRGFGDSFRGVLSHPAGLHYVGLLDGKPAGALSLFYEAELGGVYNVGTFPAYRGQGVASALLLNLLAVARQLGLQQLMLQTLHHGPAQPIYERTGFHTHFVRNWYLPAAPGGIWSS